MAYSIRVRRDTNANWTNENPILALGEIGFDSTNNRIKVGNGLDTWLTLDYLTSDASIPVGDKGDIVVTDNGDTWTIDSNTVSFSKLQDISTQRLIGRNTISSGDPQEVTVTQILDWISSTQGSILYRNASEWVSLSPGTSGQVLTTNGPSANPSWTTVSVSSSSSGITNPIVPFSTIPLNAGWTYPIIWDISGLQFETLGVRASIASNYTYRLFFNLPTVIPSGTLKLRLLMLANATSGTARINIGWVKISVGSNPNTSVVAEGVQSVTWAGGEAYIIKELKTTLDATTLPSGGDMLKVDLVFESASYTLAADLGLIPTLIWE